MQILKTHWKPLGTATATLLTILIASVLIYNRKTDRGFMRRKCSVSEGAGELKWRPSDYPLWVHVDAQYLPQAREVVRDLNAMLGPVNEQGDGPFHLPMPLDPFRDYRDPVILIRGRPRKGHASAHLKWTLGCALRRVEIEYPSMANANAHRILTHELGHALGLAHDDYEGWVMHPSYQFVGNKFSRADIERVRGTFR